MLSSDVTCFNLGFVQEGEGLEIGPDIPPDRCRLQD